MRGKANPNFFKKPDADGAGGDIIIAAPPRNQAHEQALHEHASKQARGGRMAPHNQAAAQTQQLSGKALESALKRAKQTGTLSLQGRELAKFPQELIKFEEL